HDILKVEADRRSGGGLVVGIFGSAQGAVEEVPATAPAFDIETPTFESAGEAGGAAFGRWERSGEIFGQQQLAGSCHERAWLSISRGWGRIGGGCGIGESNEGDEH